jgi:rubredoxin
VPDCVKELFRSPDSGRVAAHRAILEAADLQCFVRNEDTQQLPVAGLATAIFPLPDFWPTLCLINDEDYPEAMQILRSGTMVEPVTDDWVCPECNQPVPGNFDLCWSCRRAKAAIGQDAAPPADAAE